MGSLELEMSGRHALLLRGVSSSSIDIVLEMLSCYGESRTQNVWTACSPVTGSVVLGFLLLRGPRIPDETLLCCGESRSGARVAILFCYEELL